MGKRTLTELLAIASFFLSLGQQHHPCPIPRLGLLIRRDQIDGSVAVIENDVWDLPRLHDRLGEDRTRVGGLPLLMEIVAANPDDEKERQFQIVDDIAKRVASFKQAGTLDEHDRPFAAQQEPRGDGNGFAFAADAD